MIGALLIKRNVPKGVARLNQRDLDAYLKDWADDAVLDYPGNVPGVSGTHRRKEAIRKYYDREMKLFPFLRITPRHTAVSSLFDMTGSNVVILQWDAEVKNKEGFLLKNSGVSVMTIKNRKVTHIQIFIFNTGEEFLTLWKAASPKD